MKFFVAILFIVQLSQAQIGTNGGFQTPVQMGISAISAVLTAVNLDYGFSLWVIKNVTIYSVRNVKVEFTTDTGECTAFLYKITVDANESYSAALDKNTLVKCSK